MLKHLLLKFRWLLIVATILSVVSAFAGIWMLTMITDAIGAMNVVQRDLLTPFLWFLIAVLTVMFFGISSQYLLAKLSARVVFDLRDMLSKRLLATPYEKVERMGGHRVLSTMRTDVSTLSNGIMTLPEFIYSLVTVMLCLGYMAYMSLKLFALVIGLIAIIVAIAQVMVRFGLVQQAALRLHDDEMFKGLKAMIDGGKELNVNAHRRRFFYRSVLRPNFKEIQNRTVKASLIFIALNSWTAALTFFVIGSVVFGAQWLFTDVPIETVVAFVLVILYMVEPLEEVIDTAEDFGDFSVSYKKINSLDLSEHQDFDNAYDEKSVDASQSNWQSLSVNNLSYQYNPSEEDDYCFSIGPISATFQRGTSVFLTGGNGSGKSTFAKVLAGLYHADSGSLRLDEHELGTTLNSGSYQRNISTIFSDFYLFDHVLTGEGKLANDADIATTLEALQLDHKVSSASGKLSSVDLSTGQKKRLALLMSRFENTSICIYDEWAADQDPHFREYFYTTIIPELKRQNKLVIVITHDDRYFNLADQLLKLESGLVVQDSLQSTTVEKYPDVSEKIANA